MGQRYPYRWDTSVINQLAVIGVETSRYAAILMTRILWSKSNGLSEFARGIDLDPILYFRMARGAQN
jgi:hypothetical protein